ncbi:MAG TPA: LON peptidase substrate-binding domain-containing protein [Acidimicrobiales bacterium]
MAVSPMFPLGTVLFPSQLLPLHVFEPRYRQLTVDCLRDDRGFGVVLIERGSEVGGGDVRTNVGTLARIVQAQPFPDGRWALMTVGTTRVRVVEWLPDDPYPRAEIDELPDDAASPNAAEALQRVVPLLRAVLARKAELGEPAAAATTELSDDVVLASYQASAVAPVGPVDHQRLLCAPGPDARLALLRELLEDERAFLDARLAIDGRGDMPHSGEVG